MFQKQRRTAIARRRYQSAVETRDAAELDDE
ncbi:hypothetical protein MAXJ12_34984 [Mesorhizobium alhagi CCNWXJ12-2]|uniref:Uncharacterized protein n=1 Tax=Mesorhizobium alhagi CCNWXJ12-2 TaxID=1107882 RepID=H0I3D2_9HYPH|nr:hypothetical protein MAXJ12_34984 [Mesorhizobium alhagi CCNWXJ12-2]